MNKTVTKIFHNTLPSFFGAYLQSDAMQRLKGVDMNCGVNNTSFPLFALKEPYTRFEHSLNAALIAWHFSQDPRQALATLFHDIATPAFAHVVDFLHGDHLHQESTEEKTAEIIQTDGKIMTLLARDGIAFHDICDYHRYPICDNDSPRLSADRLEYTFSNLLRYRLADTQDVRRMYEDIRITKNEEGIDELAFQNQEVAVLFAGYALRCGRIYSSSEHRFAMETLAGILKRAIDAGVISEKDLYTDEASVILKLQNSFLKDDWQKYTKLKAVHVLAAYEPEALIVDAKKRYIDPLVIGKGRCRDLDPQLKNSIHAFLNEDYNVFLKGEYDE